MAMSIPSVISNPFDDLEKAGCFTPLFKVNNLIYDHRDGTYWRVVKTPICERDEYILRNTKDRTLGKFVIHLEMMIWYGGNHVWQVK
jgi:hypothetical protein